MPSVTNTDLVKNCAAFYQVSDKICQDRTLSRFLGICESERQQKKGVIIQKKIPKKVSVKYYINTVAYGRIPVSERFLF